MQTKFFLFSYFSRTLFKAAFFELEFKTAWQLCYQRRRDNNTLSEAVFIIVKRTVLLGGDLTARPETQYRRFIRALTLIQ